MENLVATRNIARFLQFKMRQVNNILRYYRARIMGSNFTIMSWVTDNMREMEGFVWNMNRYKYCFSPSQELLGHMEVCQFYWHHLVDLFARETLQYAQTNITLLDQQIEHFETAINVATAEIARLDAALAPQ